MAVSLHQWARCPTRLRAAPALAHTPRLEDHAALSVPSRNGSVTLYASWALMPEERRENLRSRCAGQTGARCRRFYPKVKINPGLWNHTITTPSSPVEIWCCQSLLFTLFHYAKKSFYLFLMGVYFCVQVWKDGVLSPATPSPTQPSCQSYLSKLLQGSDTQALVISLFCSSIFYALIFFSTTYIFPFFAVL